MSPTERAEQHFTALCPAGGEQPEGSESPMEEASSSPGTVLAR